VQLTQCIDGGEPVSFKSIFTTWIDKDDTQLPDTPKTKETGVLPSFLPDDANGTFEIFRIKGKELVKVAQNLNGIFFEKDSYVIKYVSINKATVIIYTWLGNKCSPENKKTAASKAAEIDKANGGVALIIRILQGKEPEHFLRVFKGQTLIIKNCSGHGLSDLNDALQLSGSVKARLFHVRGTCKDNTRLIEVDCDASSLNSDDVFLAINKNNAFVWIGKTSDDFEGRAAQDVVKKFDSRGKINKIDVKEGTETDEFWSLVGGKSTLSSRQFIVPALKTKRLFHCSNASGKFKVQEIFDFTQQDLDTSDVMLLDVYDCVFVWIGKGSNDEEKELSFQAAMDFLDLDTTPRNSQNTLIMEIKEGVEPLEFTQKFNGWKKF